MNRRQAKRVATGLVADLVEQHGERLARTYGTPDDRDRMRACLQELGQEMRVRSGRTPLPGPDPHQVALFERPTVVPNQCCDDTGYADYAAVLCPNPRCTAVARVIAEHQGRSS